MVEALQFARQDDRRQRSYARVMATWETRLAPLLGGPPALVEYAHLTALVDAATEEDPQLDFKAGLYGTSGSYRREMAADIAAMANDRGGVILLGVAETDGVATGLPGVEISDAEVL